MLAEIAIRGTWAGTVVSQVAVVIPEFDLVGCGAFDLGSDFVVGSAKTSNRADGKIFLTG